MLFRSKRRKNGDHEKMLSSFNPKTDDRLDRAPGIDDGTFLRIQLIRPVEKAASPIIDHNIELIGLANTLKKWYLGKGVVTPRELLSDLLNPHDNNACALLNDFIATTLRFKPGAFPAHCDAVRELQFTTVRLIRTLMDIIDAPALVEALKRVGAFFATLADPINFTLSDHDHQQRLNTRLTQLIEAFDAVSGVFKIRERERDFEIAFRHLPDNSVTKEDVAAAMDFATDRIVSAVSANERKTDTLLAVADETVRTVRRIDKRGKRSNSRQKFSVEIQEACFQYWERGRKSAAVKENSTGKVRYEHVFTYYRKELFALGVKDEKSFKRILIARSKRISKTQTRQK